MSIADTVAQGAPLFDDEYGPEEEHEPAFIHIALARIALVAVSVALVGLGVLEGSWLVGGIAVVVTLVGGFPILAEAWEAIPARRMTMELSMTIALLAALVIGEFLTGLVIVLFVLIAEEIEKLTVGRRRRAMEDTLAFRPRRVFLRSGGDVREVDASEARPGDVVVVKPGARGPDAGTPLAILGAIGRAARQGSIIKGGIALEVLGHAHTIVLDKTGTLTFGRPV